MAEVVAAALTAQAGQSGPRDRRVFLLETMAQAAVEEVPRPWVDALAAIMRESRGEARGQAVRAAAVLQVPALDETLLALARSDGEPRELRLEALRAVVGRHPALSPPLFEMVMACMKAEASPLLRLAAAEVASRARLADDQIERFLEAARDDSMVSPGLVLRVVARAAGGKVGPPVLSYLEEALRRGFRPREEELTRLIERLPGELEARGKSLIDLLRRSAAKDSEKLAGFQSLLGSGSAERGRSVFFDQKAACSTCHRVGNEGGQVGPDLTRVAASRSGRDLLESIVLPSSTFAQGYESYAVATKDGQVLTGVIARQTEAVLVLRDASGAEIQLQQQKIETIDRQETSIMPEALDRALDPGDLRDLLAFLMGLK
jgi:putative heme-binding domain-containing protein